MREWTASHVLGEPFPLSSLRTSPRLERFRIIFGDSVGLRVGRGKYLRTKLGTKLSGRVTLQKHPAHPDYDLSENS